MPNVTLNETTGNDKQQNDNDDSFCTGDSASAQPTESVCNASEDASKTFHDVDTELPMSDSFRRSNNENIHTSVIAEIGIGTAVDDSQSMHSTSSRRKSRRSAITEYIMDREEAKWLSWVERQFQQIAGEDGEIDLPEFKKALEVKESFFAERFFALFDQDRSGTIECSELMHGMRTLMKGTPIDKLKFLFNVYDVDGSGTIDRDELKVVLSSCMEESSLELSEEHLDLLTDALMKSADEDESGAITFDELESELNKHPGILENLTISAAQWMKPPEKKKRKPGMKKYFTKAYIQNNLRKVVYYCWYILANVAVYFYGAYNYRHENGFIIAARGGGMALNFNCMWILVLVLRRCITFLRCTSVFYWTHMLYVPFWIFTILHAPRFWHWFIVPGFIFFLEKTSRSKLVKLATYGKTYIKEVHLLPSAVTHLVISRPRNMRFRPGDYVFIQIPAIAAHEWHPFTISSAPEMKGSFWLHIRTVGHWTGKLHKYFEDYDPNATTLSGVDNTAFSPGPNENMERGDIHDMGKKKGVKQVNVMINIDGPYGTPTREIFDTEHAVLIGAGIGVTPFASILQSIMYRLKKSKQSCPKCNHTWYGDIPDCIMKLRKVDFVWVNRDQKCFEWFVQLLTELEVEQSEIGGDHRVLDMHMFMTAALSKTDMKGIGLQMALDLIHKQENRDLITGLKTKTQPGRPDWHKIFTEIKEQRIGKVKIFFCGPNALGKAIKDQSEKFDFGFSKETF